MAKYAGMLNLLLQREGSIIPVAVQVATPCAILSGLLKFFEVNELAGFHILFDTFKIKGAAYGSFSSLLGFLVVFRTSQAYNRYWTGGGLMQQMVGSWFDSASSIFAFLKMSKAGSEEIRRFEHLLVRLYSILTALALTELDGPSGEDDDEDGLLNRLNSLEIIDAQSLDAYTIEAISKSENKMELIYHWMQVVLVDGIERGIVNIPPPILSRAFAELADGMAKFHDCMKIALLPFPFPYSQAALVLLILHWLITPLMICTWTGNPCMAALFSFLIIFIFWGLYAIANEIENPFGDDPNDLDAIEVQRDMNEKLRLLAGLAGSSPGLNSNISVEELDSAVITQRSTLKNVWQGKRRVSHFTNIGSSARRNSHTLDMEPLLQDGCNTSRVQSPRVLVGSPA